VKEGGGGEEWAPVRADVDQPGEGDDDRIDWSARDDLMQTLERIDFTTWWQCCSRRSEWRLLHKGDPLYTPLVAGA